MQNYKHDFLDNFYFFDHLNSTNDKAIELIEMNQTSGTFAVVAAKQRQGTGRKGKFWYSPAGGLYLTLAIYGFKFNSSFTLFLGTAIHKALMALIKNSESCPLNLKWPNDIYLNDKKIAGIIVQNLNKNNYYLCGIGINTNTESFPDELKNIASSIKLTKYGHVDNLLLLDKILDVLNHELPEYLANMKIPEYYHKYDYLKGKNISINTEFSNISGLYKGVNKEGALLLQLNNGSIQPLYAGSVSIP